MVYSLSLIVRESVFEPVYLAGSGGSVTISVLEVDFVDLIFKCFVP
jgi:hypothetical protein